MPDDHISLPATTRHAEVSVGFGNLQSFEFTQRAAKALATSTLVPEAFRGRVVTKKAYGDTPAVYEDNPNALSNCIIALNMASRMGADVLMVMQNLYVVEGRPSWSAQFVIAAINSCGRFSPLRFDISAPGDETEVEFDVPYWENRQRLTRKAKVKVKHRTCRAWAIEKATGERLDGPEVSIEMAIAEAWLTKNGSKWQTMPEVMLRYRSAAFFGRLYAPELLMGLQTSEEAVDAMIDITPISEVPGPARPTREQFAAAASSEPEKQSEVIPQEEAKIIEGFAFVDTDGVETEVADPIEWANLFYNALKAATGNAQIATGLWDTNSSQLERLRVAVENGAQFADQIENAYGAAIGSNKKGAVKERGEDSGRQPQATATPTPTAAPAQQAPIAPIAATVPRALGALPKKDGSFDAASTARILGDAIETSVSIDDVTEWQKLNMDWIEWLSKNAPPFAKMAEKRIAAVREILSGAEA